jgi:hypothetical protein
MTSTSKKAKEVNKFLPKRVHKQIFFFPYTAVDGLLLQRLKHNACVVFLVSESSMLHLKLFDISMRLIGSNVKFCAWYSEFV